ncbi:MAG: hypothetical protein QM765_24175 [Myxococcales bacterium]
MRKRSSLWRSASSTRFCAVRSMIATVSPSMSPRSPRRGSARRWKCTARSPTRHDTCVS